MKDRIAHIMRAKNLKATDFAALLGIQPSGVSHILAGRNNPSLEFVKKIKETFPEYNLDWIIFGTGPMTTSEPYKDAFRESIQEPSSPPEQLSLNPVWESENPSSPTDSVGPVTTTTPSVTGSNGVKSILVLYEDGSFEQFTPR